jgi:hypothetical protein
MNAVEIEEAISKLAAEPFDPAEFPYAFLEAFGNKATTIKRLRTGNNNKSDIEGGVLQQKNIHMAVCPAGEVKQTLDALRASPATTKQKAKFIFATDGEDFQAEDLINGDTVACDYIDFPNYFGFFLALAGISAVKEITENAFDIRATSRLNKLYVELLRTNPDWSEAERRHDMNHFMARLIFCFFAEDTEIFNRNDLFTTTVDKMSANDFSITHEVISEIFRAMNTKHEKRQGEKIKRWAHDFPYVNGGLFSGSTETPKFSKIARSYLLHVGSLDWTQINPDIFGSMIQAVADDEERGSLGMHYTSVPNILKVLNPLFLDDLREKLEEAGDSKVKLLNLRKRISRIRVFDPACGSGNFLVIAYKQLREIEAEINIRRGEKGLKTEIPLTNFRGIELRDFSAEIARLALIIAEYQCDVFYRGQKEALQEFLPLDAENWITQGNALRMDWLSICHPTEKAVKLRGDDLFNTPVDQTEIDFENEGGETYICGNPPYLGSKWQSIEQKEDIGRIFDGRVKGWKSLDYVSGWFMKAADYALHTPTVSAFVSTNSICQGQQVPILWPLIFKSGHEIAFAHTSFKWANLASHNAGVTVVIVAIANRPQSARKLYSISENGETVVKQSDNINPYLVNGSSAFIDQARNSISGLHPMLFGNMPRDGGNLIFSDSERLTILSNHPDLVDFFRPYLGSVEIIQGKQRWCIWIEDTNAEFASQHPFLKVVLDAVKENRLESPASSTREFAIKPHRFVQIAGTAKQNSLAIPTVSSERRPCLPVELLNGKTIVSNLAFALYDAPLWNMSLIASKLHLVWIATVCGKLKTDFRYSNTMGWNTFPVPKLTEKNKEDLTRCAEDILIAREQYFPATIADMYDPKHMDEKYPELRRAHERNDEVLERIYIGRRFKNDTERLEKLFDLYTKMTNKKETA